MNTYINIYNKQYLYTPINLTYENSTPLDLVLAKENLLLFNKIANEENFLFLLFYGTLLGAIREKGFIKHDIDIDIVTVNEKKLLDIIPLLQANGFFFVRYDSQPSLKTFATLYSFMRGSVYIDVYIAYKEKSKYNILGSYIPLGYIDKTVDIDFIGSTFKIPQQYKKILILLYGKHWNIPKQNTPGDFKKSKTFKDKIVHILGKLIPKILKQKIKNY